MATHGATITVQFDEEALELIRGVHERLDEISQRLEALEKITGYATMNDLEAAYRVHVERDHAKAQENT